VIGCQLKQGYTDKVVGQSGLRIALSMLYRFIGSLSSAPVSIFMSAFSIF